MRLFNALANIASMPLRVAVDVVTFPKHLVEGEHLLPNSADGLRKVEEDLEDGGL